MLATPQSIPVRLERTMLFVPAGNRHMIEKAAASAADAVCLDLEDATAPAEKPAARASAIQAFQQIDFGRRTRILRINGVDTHFAYRDLVEVVEAAGDRIDLIMVPKVGAAGDLEFVDRLLTQIEAFRGYPRRLGIEAQIESAAGFLHAAKIAAASPRLEAMIFGPGDFSASMRMPSTGIGAEDEYDRMVPGHRWHAVMLTIVAAARAHGLRCIDGPYAAYKDAAGWERSCRIAQAMGFDGKQCIHPSQLATANATFSPSAAEAAHARAILAACREAEQSGRGVVSLDGKMLDAASIRMAQVTVARLDLLERSQP